MIVQECSDNCTTTLQKQVCIRDSWIWVTHLHLCKFKKLTISSKMLGSFFFLFAFLALLRTKPNHQIHNCILHVLICGCFCEIVFPLTETTQWHPPSPTSTLWLTHFWVCHIMYQCISGNENRLISPSMLTVKVILILGFGSTCVSSIAFQEKDPSRP
jgi:hypothetical protein